MNSDMFAGRSDLRSETWIYGDASSDHIDSVRADAVAYVAQDRFTLTEPGRSSRGGVPDDLAAAFAGLRTGGARLPERGWASYLTWITLCGNYAGKIGVSALVGYARELAAKY